jgi:hypothetical protein
MRRKRSRGDGIGAMQERVRMRRANLKQQSPAEHAERYAHEPIPQLLLDQ